MTRYRIPASKQPVYTVALMALSILALLACAEETPADGVNKPPIIHDVAFPAQMAPGDAVNIAVIATDPDDEQHTLTYTWNIVSGDGLLAPGDIATLGIPSTTYTAPINPGIKQLSVKVQDGAGLSDRFTFQILVRELAAPNF